VSEVVGFNTLLERRAIIQCQKIDNMEFLKAMLAEMKAKMDGNQAKAAKQEEMLKAMQEKADADRIADREYMKQIMARTDDNQERMEADRKVDRGELKGMNDECNPRKDGRKSKGSNRRHQIWPSRNEIHRLCIPV
jgi:hypothetical protein